MEYIPLASGALGALGSINSGQTSAASYASSAAAARYNATVNSQNAANALQVGYANEDAQRRKNAIALGTQRAALIQAGIGTDGSAADVYQQSAANAELDALATRYEGTMNARRYAIQASQDQYAAQVADWNSERASTGGYLGAAASLLKGAGGYLANRGKASGGGFVDPGG